MRKFKFCKKLMIYDQTISSLKQKLSSRFVFFFFLTTFGNWVLEKKFMRCLKTHFLLVKTSFHILAFVFLRKS